MRSLSRRNRARRNRSILLWVVSVILGVIAGLFVVRALAASSRRRELGRSDAATFDFHIDHAPPEMAERRRSPY